MNKATKKALSGIIALSIAAGTGIMPVNAAIGTMEYDNGTVTVTADEAGTGVLIKASADGVSVLKKDVTVNAGTTTISDVTAAAGDKLYLWDGFENIKPLTTVLSVVNKFTVTFKNGEETVSTAKVVEGEKAVKPETDPTKDGYIFQGWYLGDAKYDFETPVTGDITLEAKFIKGTAYINENFDSYEKGTIIKSAKSGENVDEKNPDGKAFDPVTKGSIVYSAGYRKDGIYDSASIAEGEGVNELLISADKYATSNRGVSFAFADSVAIPKVSEIEDTEVLELSAKIKADQTLTVTGYGDITTADLTTTSAYVNVSIILDKSANKQYQIITDTDGTVLSSKVSALNATTFTGMSFYIGAGAFHIDNLKVIKKEKDTGIITATVTDSGESNAPLAGATVKVGTLTFTTDANGNAEIALPNGTYKVSATKSGYEHTSEKDDAAVADVTINSDKQTANLTLQIKVYIKVPDTVTIKDGQNFIAAPKTEETASTDAFTVEVLDQYGIPMTADEYGLTWSIYTAGTTEEDANVTIDDTGVVTVSKAFNVDEKVKAYDVTAVAATDDRNNKVTKTLYVGNNDIIYYEPTKWNNPGGTNNRGAEWSFKSATTMPDMSNVTLNMNFGSTEGQCTLALITDTGALVGLQYVSGGTVKVWTGWTGNSTYNQSGDVDKFTNSEVLIEKYTAGTDIEVNLVIDKVNKNITASCSGTTVSVPYTMDSTKITGMKTGQYRSGGAVTINNVTIQEPDANYLSIAGDEDFAKVSGKTITRTYGLGQSVLVKDETFTWTVEAPAEAAADAVTVENGVLSVSDTATPGVYTLKAVSNINEEKNAELEITIADFQGDDDDIQVTLSGAQAYNKAGETGTYSVAKVTDQFGDDITALLPAAVWTSSNTEVATIDPATGELTVVGAGTTTVTATITNGTATITKTVPVTVAVYSITGDATGNSTTVDTSALVKGEAIAKYLVTTATADGNKVKSTEVDAAAITAGSYAVDTTGADKYEIAPVFTYHVGAPGTLGNYGAGFDIVIPADTYNFTVTANGNRSDVYVNNQLLVNNILQGANVVKTLDVNDVVVKEGVAKITTADYASGQNETGVNIDIKVVKSPSIVNRETKMYVLGDSLVCIYYNGGNSENASAQTGWGQVLQNYVKDVEVVNLANSGVTANGLLGTAFTQVLESAKPGDYMVLESGYNDRTRDTEAIMKNALNKMIEGAEAKGVKVILVSPNASQHDYKSDVVWTTFMEDVATETETDYIDLSQKSYDFLNANYATDTDTIKATYNVSDGLHSTFNGANKWAAVVAQGLYDLGMKDIVNTEYSYTFTDTKGNSIECTVTPTADTSAE